MIQQIQFLQNDILLNGKEFISTLSAFLFGWWYCCKKKKVPFWRIAYMEKKYEWMIERLNDEIFEYEKYLKYIAYL